ncbi:MAG: cyanoexosortase A system-associated protein [Crinalium sp.]
MSFSKHLRISLLVITNAFVILVVGKIILAPSIDKDGLFPDGVPLPKWQLIESREIQPISGKPWIFPGRDYRYIQNQLPLTISMRYVEFANGDVKELIDKHTSIKLSTVKPKVSIRQQPGVGFYGVYVYQQRAYLDACINASGSSTFTAEQFSNNRKRHQLQLNRLLGYLFTGTPPLHDQRCLWSHLSIPLKDASAEAAYNNLETLWLPWYTWWSSHFYKN